MSPTKREAAPKPIPPWKRAEAGRYRSSDERFTISSDPGGAPQSSNAWTARGRSRSSISFRLMSLATMRKMISWNTMSIIGVMFISTPLKSGSSPPFFLAMSFLPGSSPGLAYCFWGRNLSTISSATPVSSLMIRTTRLRK